MIACNYLCPAGVLCPVCREMHKNYRMSPKTKWVIGLTVLVITIAGIVIGIYRSDTVDEYMYERSLYRYRMNNHYGPDSDTGEIRPRKVRRY